MKNLNTKELNIFITGANGGMGLDTSKLLIQQNVKQIVLGARTQIKADEAKRKLDQNTDIKTRLIPIGGFDMTAPDRIAQAVTNLGATQPFDIVFLQAGGVVFKDDYQYVNWKGKRYERTVFQNTIGGYITLLELSKRGLLKETTRVVFAGGEGARGIPGMIDKPVFNGYTGFTNYLFGTGNLPKFNPMNGIGVSKLMSAVLVQALAKKRKGTQEFVWFTPGLTYGTNGLADTPAIQRYVMEKIAFPIAGLLGFAQSPMQGAQKYVDSLLGKYGSNGDVLGSPEGKVLGPIVDQKPMNDHFTDSDFQMGFLNLLEQEFGGLE